jgi:squalene-hopene/tetraprenyl-beta-curcumene cyclase
MTISARTVLPRLIPCLAAVVAVGALAAPLRAADAPAPPDKAKVEDLIDKAQTWIMSKQLPTGAYMPGNQFVLGLTGLAADALVTAPKAIPADNDAVAKALALLKANQQPDGGIYNKDEGLGNYTTSITLIALANAGQLDANKDFVKKAQNYIFGVQRNDGSVRDGGFGYDQEDGPTHQDITNTSFGINALHASGVPSDDPHMKKALEFLQRCQNLSSVNKLPWAAAGANDGGGVYCPEESGANGSWVTPEEKANPTTKLASTGSMTYTLLESYLSLDLKAGDPRVDAALGYCKAHYQFDANPGMIAGKEHQGLFYYYVFMGRTLHMLDIKTFTTPDGKTVDWRADLFKAISDHAIPVTAGGKPGVMWTNDAPRWGEGMPQLSTIYMLKALKAIDATL